MTYKAFISYSHGDHSLQARKIYQLISRFATPWYRRRRMHLFLDDASLPATPSLWKSIEEAINESEFFIFLASPSAASSEWCIKEISYWIEHKSQNTIIIVLLSGKIKWDSRNNDFNWANTSALPNVLSGVFVDEPRYIDLSKIKEAAKYKDLAERGKLAEIASVLLDKPKDDLISEDLRLYKRTLRLAWAASLILLTTSILAIWQWNQATIQRDLANERLSQAVDITQKMLFDIDDKLVGVAGAGDLRRSLTYDALSLLIELRQKAIENEDVEWAQMVAYYQKGNLALRYDDLNEAESAFVESQKIAERMVNKQPNFIEPYHSWALSYHAIGKVKTKKKLYTDAYDNFDYAKQLADFILEDTPNDDDTQLLLLNLYLDWGDAAYENQDMALAHKNYLAGIELIDQLTSEHPDDAEYWFIYTLMLDRKARYYPIHTDPQGLLDVREEAVDILERLVDEFPDVSKYHLNLAIAYEKLGDIAYKVGNLEGANLYYSHATRAMQALYTAEPINNIYKKMLATDYGNLGETLMELGKFDEAFDLFEQENAWMQSLTIADPDNQDYTFDFIIAKRHMGDYYRRTQNLSKAEDFYQSAIQFTISLLEKNDELRGAHLLLAATRTELSELLLDIDRSRTSKLIWETTADLEQWLQKHQEDGEGWMYLAQARLNSYLLAVRNGNSDTAGQLKSKTKVAIYKMSKDDRKKFANEINNILNILEK